MNLSRILNLTTWPVLILLLNACAQFKVEVYPLAPQADTLRSTSGLRLLKQYPWQSQPKVVANTEKFLPVYGGSIQEPVQVSAPVFDQNNLVIELRHPSTRGAFNEILYRYRFQSSEAGFELIEMSTAQRSAKSGLFHNSKAMLVAPSNGKPMLFDCPPKVNPFECEADTAASRSVLKGVPLIPLTQMPFALDYSVQIDSPLL